MSDGAPAAPGVIESASALGLMVGGAAIMALTLFAAVAGLPFSAPRWWMWLVPLWAVVAIPLGWSLRRRSAPARQRNFGRIWLIAAAVPLVVVLGFGKPMQKVMLEQEAEANK